MKSRYTLSQSQKRYSFLEGVYHSVAVEKCDDGQNQEKKKRQVIIRKRRTVKPKNSENEKETQREEQNKIDDDEKESTWNLKEEDFDDI